MNIAESLGVHTSNASDFPVTPDRPGAISAPVVFALRGAPGVGKSTVSSLLDVAAGDVDVIEVDALRARKQLVDWSDRSYHRACLREAATRATSNLGRCSVIVDVMGRDAWPMVRTQWQSAGHLGACISLVADDHELSRRLSSRAKCWGDLGSVLAINREIRNSCMPDEILLDSSDQSPAQTAGRVLEIIRLHRGLSTVTTMASMNHGLALSGQIACLTATRGRLNLLGSRALASVARQIRHPDIQLIVNDGPIGDGCRVRTLARDLGLNPVVLQNENSPGAAGAWNTGLNCLRSIGFTGFVAMLDDDDEWDSDHLVANLASAEHCGGNLCVSGLRISRDGVLLKRPLIDNLSGVQFLVGNPGWQGSNTFIDFDLLTAVGGFDEKLESLHDRDLAVRVLASEKARPVLISQFTATWHVGTEGALSTPQSPQKLNGLRTFWFRNRGLMTRCQRKQFFARAERLFGFTESLIIGDANTPSAEITT